MRIERDRAASVAAAVGEFITFSPEIPSFAALGSIVADLTARLGFEYYAIGYHVIPADDASPRVGITNYPPAWRGELRRGLAHDPVVRAAEQRAAGFAWEDLPTLLTLTVPEKARLERAARHGLSNGYTVPSHVPGEALGSSNFAVGPERELPRGNLFLVQSLGGFAFEAVRRLLRDEAGGRLVGAGPLADPLTRRQRECLGFVARGKSDSVIADILGIRPHTVTEHIEAARRRYSVATRAQVIVRALLAGDLTYGEIV